MREEMDMPARRQNTQVNRKVVIEVKGVHKKYRVYYDKGRSFKEKILFQNRNKYEDRWVLKGIDMSVKTGEAVGLLGVNGCGKSTFLKLLSRIMYPDKGTIRIEGRVSCLIELGAGFHPDLSGRENIYTNAAIFGLTKSEIDERLSDIIAFSELGECIDNPVRTYSSGMYARLAFSVAINVDADVLLIDEILAVGDANFQTKCFRKLREMKAKGMTIVIVSHDITTIEMFCDQALWISDGVVASSGKAKNVVEDYKQYLNGKLLDSVETMEEAEEPATTEEKTTEAIPTEEKTKEDVIVEETTTEAETAKAEAADGEATEAEAAEEEDPNEIDYSANRFGLKYIEIVNVVFRNKAGKRIRTFIEGEPASIEIHYEIHKPLEEYNFGMGFYTADGELIYGVNTQLDGISVKLDDTKGYIVFHVEEMQLLTGQYFFQVAVVDINAVPMDYFRKYCDFDVVSTKKAIGTSDVKHHWDIHPKNSKGDTKE